MTFQTKMKMWWGSVVDDTEKIFNKNKKRMVTHEFYDNPNPPSARPKSMHRIGSRASAGGVENTGSRRGSMGPRTRSFGSQNNMAAPGSEPGSRNGSNMAAVAQGGQYYDGGVNPYNAADPGMMYATDGMGYDQGYGGQGMQPMPPGTMQPAYTGMPPPMNAYY